MRRRPPRSTRVRSSAASDVYKRQVTVFESVGGITVLACQSGKEVPTEDSVFVWGPHMRLWSRTLSITGASRGIGILVNNVSSVILTGALAVNSQSPVIQ